MKNILRSELFGITLVSGFSKLLGLAREMLFAAVYGTGILAAAYDGALSVPVILFDIFFGCAIGSALIPIIFKAKYGEKDESREFINGSAGVILLVSGALTVFGMIFSEVILRTFTQGLSSVALELAETLLVTLFPTLLLHSVSYFFIATLHAMGYFIFPNMTNLFATVAPLAYLLLPDRRIEGLAIATLFGSAIQVIILYFYSRNVGYRCIPTLKISREHSKSALYLTLQGALPCILTPIIELVSIYYSDKYMGGRGITIFLYANRIFMTCAGFFAFVFSSFLLPLLSKREAEGNRESSNIEFRKYASMLLVILIPITLLVLIFSDQIIKAVFGHGSFGAEDIELCANALRAMAFGIPFFALSEISVKAYFARRKCIYPSICAVISLIFFVTGLSISPFKSQITDVSIFLAASYVIYGILLVSGLKIIPTRRKRRKVE